MYLQSTSFSINNISLFEAHIPENTNVSLTLQKDFCYIACKSKAIFNFCNNTGIIKLATSPVNAY